MSLAFLLTVATPIIGGSPAQLDPAVVALTTSGGTINCSGTVVSPRVIVTAAHCVHGQPLPGWVFVGSDPALDGVFLPVASARSHPSYRANNTAADIAIVVLARPVPFTVPPFASSPPSAAELDGPARFVGFGAISGEISASSGIKKSHELRIDALSDNWLAYGVVGCHGDSGGPVFLRDERGTERLSGVISRGDPKCEVGGLATRVDLYAGWLVQQIAEVDPPSCFLDHRCAAECTEPDPDCEASPEEATIAGGCSASSGDGALLVLLALAGLRSRRRA